MSYNFSVGVPCRVRVVRNGKEILRQELSAGTHDIPADPGERPCKLVGYLLLEGATEEICIGSSTYSALDIGKHLLAKARAMTEGTLRRKLGLLRKAMQMFLNRGGEEAEAVPLIAQTCIEMSSACLDSRIRSSWKRRVRLAQAIGFRERALGPIQHVLKDKQAERNLRVELSLMCVCKGDHDSAALHAKSALELERGSEQPNAESSYVYSTAALAYSKLGQHSESDRILVEGISRLQGSTSNLTRLLLARWQLMPAKQA